MQATNQTQSTSLSSSTVRSVRVMILLNLPVFVDDIFASSPQPSLNNSHVRFFITVKRMVQSFVRNA